MVSLGKMAIGIAIADEEKRPRMVAEVKKRNYKVCVGKVGTMNSETVVSAILTAAKREDLWDSKSFREEHAFYDTIIEAFNGICRGNPALGNIFRTVGLCFVVIRGKINDNDGEWVAVCMYGTVGPPIKGFEHEAIGLGINHI